MLEVSKLIGRMVVRVMKYGPEDQVHRSWISFLQNKGVRVAVRRIGGQVSIWRELLPTDGQAQVDKFYWLVEDKLELIGSSATV